MANTNKRITKTKKQTADKGRKKRLRGTVIRNKMTNTVIVRVMGKRAHPVYKKIIETAKKYAAHTNKKFNIGDKVVIEESKPISKTKKWKVIKKIE